MQNKSHLSGALSTVMTLTLTKLWTLEASVLVEREVKIMTTVVVESVCIPRLDLWLWSAYCHSATNLLSSVY